MTTTLTPSNLASILSFSLDLAREAGKVILAGSDAIARSAANASSDGTEGNNVEEKKNSVDLVTQYDRQVEELVKGRMKDKYPTFGFIGEEETSELGKLPELTDEPTFCVDPIDGTTNFVHGFPYVCISIGLLYQKRAVLGVIYNPFLDWMYYGTENQGSYLLKSLSSNPAATPQRLPLTPARPLPSLSQALLAIEWGSDRSKITMDAKGGSFMRLAGNPAEGVLGGRMAHSLRSVGSAALNFAAVASGQLDLYWEIGCWPWDVAAGIVIAQEAGGFVNTSNLALHEGVVTGESSDRVLTGRKYIVIRAIADSPGESCREAQKRLIKDFYDTVTDVDPQ